MTPQILLFLGLLGRGARDFLVGRISSDVIALGVLLALAFTGQRQVIMILGLLILTAALERTESLSEYELDQRASW